MKIECGMGNAGISLKAANLKICRSSQRFILLAILQLFRAKNLIQEERMLQERM